MNMKRGSNNDNHNHGYKTKLARPAIQVANQPPTDLHDLSLAAGGRLQEPSGCLSLIGTQIIVSPYFLQPTSFSLCALSQKHWWGKRQDDNSDDNSCSFASFCVRVARVVGVFEELEWRACNKNETCCAFILSILSLPTATTTAYLLLVGAKIRAQRLGWIQKRHSTVFPKGD